MWATTVQWTLMKNFFLLSATLPGSRVLIVNGAGGIGSPSARAVSYIANAARYRSSMFVCWYWVIKFPGVLTVPSGLCAIGTFVMTLPIKVSRAQRYLWIFCEFFFVKSSLTDSGRYLVFSMKMVFPSLVPGLKSPEKGVVFPNLFDDGIRWNCINASHMF